MAPKKKKKPASNPVRGFATTSIPSKPKASDALEDISLEPSQQSLAIDSDVPKNAGLVHVAPASKAGDQGTTISDMTAEQLATHLENSELEIILDKYAARSMADARRQATRLETERRQLRVQAQKLSTYTWLPEEIVQDLLDMDAEDNHSKAYLHGKHASSSLSMDEEKLSVDLWTLERLLQSLRYPRIPEALAHIAGLALENRLALLPDTLLGLSEALQWYAFSALPDEISNYEQTFLAKVGDSGNATPNQSSSGTLGNACMIPRVRDRP
jgi:ATP-dependent RNA helicase DHX29